MEDQKLLEKMKRIFRDNHLEDRVAQEVLAMVEEGHENGLFLSNEVEMIRNIFQFGNKNAKDIMTHRKNIIAINGDETLESTLKFVLDENYSRFPVYEDGIDNIIGTLHLRDIVRGYFDESLRSKQVKQLVDYIRPVSFVPVKKSIDSLFKDMQLKKNHLVIVLDEYGMTAGLAAMEDILEEIVGNILDEYDEEEECIVGMANGNYIVPGLSDLDELEKLLKIEFKEEDFDTLNGFLVDRLDHIPSEEEMCEVDYEGYCFRIKSVNDNIIQRVEIEKTNKEC